MKPLKTSELNEFAKSLGWRSTSDHPEQTLPAGHYFVSRSKTNPETDALPATCYWDGTNWRDISGLPIKHGRYALSYYPWFRYMFALPIIGRSVLCKRQPQFPKNLKIALPEVGRIYTIRDFLYFPKLGKYTITLSQIRNKPVEMSAMVHEAYGLPEGMDEWPEQVEQQFNYSNFVAVDEDTFSPLPSFAVRQMEDSIKLMLYQA
jgi:hypothetical protein